MKIEYFNLADLNLDSIEEDVHKNHSYFNSLSKLGAILLPNRDEGTPVGSNLYCDTNSRELTVVVGESWTYGDSLEPQVKVRLGKEDIPYRLTHIFGGRLAYKYKSDLLLISTPGDSNLGMFTSLNLILPEILKLKKYTDIRVAIQLTSVGRDLRVSPDLSRYSPDTNFIETLTSPKRPIAKWLEIYEELLVQKYIDVLSRSIESKFNVVFWKNFNNFYFNVNKLKQDNINFAESNWSEYLLGLYGVKIQYPFNMELDFDLDIIPYIDITLEDKIQNATDWEIFTNNIKGTSLNCNHPTVTGHWLWTAVLGKYLGVNTLPSTIYNNKKQLI